MAPYQKLFTNQQKDQIKTFFSVLWLFRKMCSWFETQHGQCRNVHQQRATWSCKSNTCMRNCPLASGLCCVISNFSRTAWAYVHMTPLFTTEGPGNSTGHYLAMLRTPGHCNTLSHNKVTLSSRRLYTDPAFRLFK